MDEKVAWIFTGQGFNIDQVKKITDMSFPCDIKKCFEETFCYSLPNLTALNPDDLKKNEVSAALILTSTLQMVKKMVQLPMAVAGYSVGQFLALYVAGSISRGELIALVFKRCKAMNKAAIVEKGSMAAILGLKYDDVALIAQKHFVNISNDNAPGNVTLAGKAINIQYACNSAIKLGAYNAQILHTAGAWHCDLMRPAEGDLACALSEISWDSPKIPIVDNVSASYMVFSNIEKQLLLHLTTKVRWRESVQFLLNQGITKFIEVSHFDLLSRMGPFISRKAQWLPAYFFKEN